MALLTPIRTIGENPSERAKQKRVKGRNGAKRKRELFGGRCGTNRKIIMDKDKMEQTMLPKSTCRNIRLGKRSIKNSATVIDLNEKVKLDILKLTGEIL